MAVYFDSSADIIGALSGGAIAGNVESRTLCGLSRIQSNTGSTQILGGFTNALGYFSAALYWRGIGDSMYVTVADGVTTSSSTFASRPAVGDLFFWYLKCSGTGSGDLEGGWCPLDGSAFVTQTITLLAGTSGACAFMAVGGAISQHSESQLAGLRQWTSPLSAADLENERHFIRAVRGANLIGDYPMWDVATSLTDFSGNGATLENLGGYGGGAPSNTDVSFPVRITSRRSGRAVFAPVVAAGTTYEETKDESVALTDEAVKSLAPYTHVTYATARVVRRRGA